MRTRTRILKTSQPKKVVPQKTKVKATRKNCKGPAIEDYISMGMDKLVTEYARLHFEMDAKQQEMDLIMQALAPVTSKEGIKEYRNRYAELEIKTAKGRDKTEIEPQELYKFLDKDEFMECVKVKVTETRKALPGKVFDKIAVVTKGPEGLPKISIKCIAPPTA